jgi:hypothetical protein
MHSTALQPPALLPLHMFDYVIALYFAPMPQLSADSTAPRYRSLPAQCSIETFSILPGPRPVTRRSLLSLRCVRERTRGDSNTTKQATSPALRCLILFSGHCISSLPRGAAHVSAHGVTLRHFVRVLRCRRRPAVTAPPCERSLTRARIPCPSLCYLTISCAVTRNDSTSHFSHQRARYNTVTVTSVCLHSLGGMA